MCAGPSLVDHLPLDDDEDITIYAVNAAAVIAPCDWWVVGDAQTLNLHDPMELRCGVVMSAPQRRTFERLTEMRAARERYPEVRAIGGGERVSDGPNWHCYTSLMALRCAWQDGARRMRVVGCDCAGVKDCLGRSGVNRSVERWSNERRMLAQMRSWLEAHEARVEGLP